MRLSYFAAPLLTPRIPSHEYALPLPSGAWQWKQPHYSGNAVPKVSLDSQHRVYKALKQTTADNLTNTMAWKKILYGEIRPDKKYEGNSDNFVVSYQGRLYKALEDVTTDDPIESLENSHWQEVLPIENGTSYTKDDVVFEDKKLRLSLGIFKVPTNLKQLRTALEAMEEFDSLDIGSSQKMMCFIPIPIQAHQSNLLWQANN